jgi:pimeloyl-ACP methyl ester carboxylesterase
VTLHYERFGDGPLPVLFLHGGWGYDLYPIDAQIAALGPICSVFVPWRAGYGTSPPVERFAENFHQTAARDMVAFLEERGIREAVVWGHSDGAVIAAWMGIFEPERVKGVILESFHLTACKPHSTAFFERALETPEALTEATRAVLRSEHGDDWHHVVRRNSDVWLRMAQSRRGDDLFAGRLAELRAPALVVHGLDDPRTEPGEIQRAIERLPNATAQLFETGKHCPHAHSKTSAAVSRALRTFVEGLRE